MRLCAPTKIIRATLSQEIRCVLPAEDTASDSLVRYVQIVPPPDQLLYIGVDIYPHEIGLNNVKQLAEILGGRVVRFHLRPEQWVVMAADQGFASVTIVVEYLVAGGGKCAS
jgi:hypothetical protein